MTYYIREELLGKSLTDLEVRRLSSVARGCSAEEIAKAAGRAVGTIKAQLLIIRAKLGARNSAHAVAIVKDKGLI